MILAWLSSLYLTAAAGIAFFGLLGAVTLWLYLRHRGEAFPCPQVAEQDLPRVTVQLPIYNEQFVVRRLIESAIKLDYPNDKLQIQVVDDSSDETTRIASALVDRHQSSGVDISLIHRNHRHGFKAGALEDALDRASGDFIAVFDADFQPNEDFLLQTIPHFIAEPDLGMVQARWGHLNSGASSLTAAQAIAMDKHFAMEQTVRHRADLFPKFNGSAGVWRRQCIIDSGGWQADTVCEDLCLSTRAILGGWQFRFLNDVVAPAELPATVSAYKNQQARWAKGSTQCLVKFGPAILTSRRHSMLARVYALVSMGGYATHLFLLLLLLTQVPLVHLGYRPPIVILGLGLLGIAQPLLFVMGQRALYPDWRWRLRYFPGLLLVAIGLAPANTRAILQALFGRRHSFVRTPKGETDRQRPGRPQNSAIVDYRLPLDWIVFVELFFAVYAATGLLLSLMQGQFGPVFFMATCTFGFSYVAVSSIFESRWPSLLAPSPQAKSGSYT